MMHSGVVRYRNFHPTWMIDRLQQAVTSQGYFIKQELTQEAINHTEEGSIPHSMRSLAVAT